MNEKIMEILPRIVIDTLERLAFVFAYVSEEGKVDDFENMEVATVPFEGPFSGSLLLAVSRQSLPEITKNMLGMEEDEEAGMDQQYDTLKETLNIVCGNLLPEIADKQSVFNIGTPEITTDAKRNGLYETYGNIISAGIDLDDGFCILSLFLEKELQ